MLGFQLIKDFKYVDVTGVNKTNKVFFFGWPTWQAYAVYSSLDIKISTGAPVQCINSNEFNIERIIELLELNDLKNKNAKMKETINADGNNIITKKTAFIEILTRRAAIIILQYVNDMIWIDTWTGTLKKKDDEKTFAITNNFDTRWKASGISLDTAFKYVAPLGKALVEYYSNLLDLRYNPDMITDVMASDFSKLMNDWSLKAGYLKH